MQSLKNCSFFIILKKKKEEEEELNEGLELCLCSGFQVKMHTQNIVEDGGRAGMAGLRDYFT